MPTTTAAKTRSRKAKTPLSGTLATISTAEAFGALRELNADFHALPSAAEVPLATQIDALEAQLTGLQVNVREMASSQAKVLSAVTGIPTTNITKALPDNQAERLHPARNLIVSCAAAAAAQVDVDSAATSPDAIYEHSVKLARRSRHITRSLADDEIYLCRIATLLRAKSKPRDHAVACYALIESGLTPGELTALTITDFDDLESPSLVTASGNHYLAARDLPIDAFAARLLAPFLDEARRVKHPSSKPLFYRGAAPGTSSASVSPHRTIDRLFARLKLPVGDLTAASLLQWRIATVLATEGLEAAHSASGRTHHQQTLRAIGEYATKPAETAKPADHGLSFAAAV